MFNLHLSMTAFHFFHSQIGLETSGGPEQMTFKVSVCIIEAFIEPVKNRQ